MNEQKNRDIFEQQCQEHEVAAAQKWDSPIIGFAHALLAAEMRYMIMKYDLLKSLEEANARITK